MKLFFVSFLFLSSLSYIYSTINSTSGAINYLSKFGYIDSNELETRNGKFDLEKFLLKFQEFFKLKKTGKLDKNTLKIMSMPR